MEPEKKEEKSRRWQKRQLVLALVMAAVVAAIMGTLAWLNYQRGLFTVTRMQMPILYLKDENGSDTSQLALGTLDIGSEEATRCVFGVYATAHTEYMLQLSHTTNLPLNYKIYRASQSIFDGFTGQVGKFYYQESDLVAGANLSVTDTHKITFGDSYPSDKVQYNAEPVYWQASNARDIKRGELQYYVLEVNWDADALTEEVKRNIYKETEMIYVTVATSLGAIDETTETTGGGA